MIQEQKRQEINRVITEEFNAHLGTPEALKVYQKAVRRVWESLTAEEKEEAETTAISWNLERGPSDDVKARWVTTVQYPTTL